MTWSYSGDPDASNLDHVRFLIGDTDTNDQLFSNEEINAALTERNNNVYLAAADLCRNAASKFARKATKSVGDLSIQFKEIFENFLKLAKQYSRDGAIRSVRGYAGGISIDDKRTVSDNTDRVSPSFYRGLQRNLGTIDDQKNSPECED